MTTTQTLKKHAALVDRMATNQGIDLQEAALRAQLTPDDISNAVLACTTCSNPEDCTRWLDLTPAGTQKPPSFCQNKPLFDDLAQS